MKPQEDAPDKPEMAPLHQWEVLGDMAQSSLDEQHEEHAQQAETEVAPKSEEDPAPDEVLAAPASLERAADEQPRSSSGSLGGHVMPGMHANL